MSEFEASLSSIQWELELKKENDFPKDTQRGQQHRSTSLCSLGSPQSIRQAKAGHWASPVCKQTREGRRSRGSGGTQQLAGEATPWTLPGTRRLLPGKASVLLAHLIPHLVVHGDALPVLKVAAVSAGCSRACTRRHRAELKPKPLTPTVWLTDTVKPPTDPVLASTTRRAAPGELPASLSRED